MHNETLQPNIPKSLKHEIGKMFLDYYNDRMNLIPTIDDREELHLKYARKAIEKLQADEEVIELCEKCMAKRIIKLSENGGIPI